ncbi:tetratricopeptide repeat protein [Actinoplanes sp. TRM 88003]|uniref:Tetratricopeptide repeat protein n=1 Tax=Paractinoplanes aksuensis TaxID=2939490 RepID=A0ABT1DU73_9ACTN|nr:AfsR/SARP family transcriptional regulator [Actinoplanes aksuensis]MCO8274398.1 tetratricopeptide repeat protein [Actinoplanes aksuensis]
MRYRILGPLSVTVDGRDVAITAGRDRIVLVMLLLHAGRVLGIGTLADAVWGAGPPTTARGQLQTCVSRLRRSLPVDAIRSDPAGYSLDPGAGELDATEFTRLVAEARESQDPALYRRALDLWRGDAAAGVDAHGVRLAAAVLDQQHVAALEAWAELEIAAGRERELVGELSAAVDRFPLREGLSGRLMQALHRSGRPADALAEYRRLRTALRDELGLDPGRELQDLHAAMLTGTITAAPPRPAPPSRVRCLPRTVQDFTGRVEVMRRLAAAVDEADTGSSRVVVIDGMAGSGKTTLALHAAALLGDRYPDAHLFVDLHGHDAEQPLEPAAALLVLLGQLGVEAERIPPGLVERVGLWRTELARRRALVLFDNAASSAQLADLLPATPGSLAVVTGRRRLLGLDGVHPESLSVLNADEGLTLLARMAGARVWAEPEAAAEVVRRCGGLPLALRLAGARLAHRPGWRVADLVRRLGESVLPELAAEQRSVASAFAVSYRQLPEPTSDVFRLLGLIPGSDFDLLAVAALTDRSLDEVRDALDDLVDVHLIDEPESGVYRFHDLLREYAAALAAEMAPEARTEALGRLFDFQLHAAVAANLEAYRGAVIRDVGLGAPARPDLLAAVTDPFARLERERAAMAAYVDAAAAVPELSRYAWQLPRAAWRHLFNRVYIDDVQDLHERALRVLERDGDLAATATMLNYLASAHYRRGAMDEAVRLQEQCIAIRRKVGTPEDISRAMINLGVIYHEMGQWARSNELAFEVRRLSVARHGRDEFNTLAHNFQRLGKYREALRYHRLRLIGQLDVGDPTRLGDTLMNIAVVKYRLGAIGLAAAQRQVRVALAVTRRAGLPHWEANVRNQLALLLAAGGQLEQAIDEHRQAVLMAEQLHSREQISRLCHGFGTTLLRAGNVLAARAMFERALAQAERARLRWQIALAQAGLGECLIAEDPDEARRLLTRARATLADLDSPNRHDVDRTLALLGGTDHLRSSAVGETMEQ